MPNTCPASSDLRRFVEEAIDDDQLVAIIEDHLESCHECQKKLDGWLENPGIASPSISEQTDPDENSIEQLISNLVSSPPQKEPPEAQHTGKELGGYPIFEPIGYGTAGVVYRSQDPKLGRPVAVKILRSDFAASDRGRTRLEREARAAASIRHQNVVDVHDICIDPIGISYLVMELVEGGTLREKLRAAGTIDPRAAVKIAQQLLLGLEAAHARGLVHRDLKASNILIEYKSGIAKLTDFGLVRDLESDSNLTRDNVIAGTPAYMSPEQVLRPHDVDHRADIYSLGVVLYEMLVGELPFLGVDRMVLQQVIHDQPRSLRRQNDAISRELETICLKAISKNPDGRYQSAREMHDDLALWLAGKPIRAHRAGPIAQAWNWSRRHAVIASLIVLSASLLILLAVGSTISAISIRASSEENRRVAAAASRQRDQSMETLRKLIFDVNELLDGDDVNIDEAQLQLLRVALDGIEAIERTGHDAGFTDFSMVAAKNRLGDVHFRLDRLEEARNQYRHALNLAEEIEPNPADEEIRIRERLRSYEGLASMAMSKRDEGSSLRWSKLAETAATELGDLTGEEVEPFYLLDQDVLIDDDELDELKEEIDEIFSDAADTVDALETAAGITQSLGWHYQETEQVPEAERVYQSLLKWLDSSAKPDQKPSHLRAKRIAKYVAYSGLADLAALRDDDEQYIQLLRQSIDALPKSNGSKRFHDSVAEFAILNLEDLLDALESRDPEPWMPTYYEFAVQLVEQESKNSPRDRPIEFRVYLAQARHIKILAECGKNDEAKRRWLRLKSLLNKLELDKISIERKRDLIQEVNHLKSLGFQWDKNSATE